MPLPTRPRAPTCLEGADDSLATVQADHEWSERCVRRASTGGRVPSLARQRQKPRRGWGEPTVPKSEAINKSSTPSGSSRCKALSWVRWIKVVRPVAGSKGRTRAGGKPSFHICQKGGKTREGKTRFAPKLASTSKRQDAYVVFSAQTTKANYYKRVVLVRVSVYRGFVLCWCLFYNASTWHPPCLSVEAVVAFTRPPLSSPCPPASPLPLHLDYYYYPTPRRRAVVQTLHRALSPPPSPPLPGRSHAPPQCPPS